MLIRYRFSIAKSFNEAYVVISPDMQTYDQK